MIRQSHNLQSSPPDNSTTPLLHYYIIACISYAELYITVGTPLLKRGQSAAPIGEGTNF